MNELKREKMNGLHVSERIEDNKHCISLGILSDGVGRYLLSLKGKDHDDCWERMEEVRDLLIRSGQAIMNELMDSVSDQPFTIDKVKLKELEVLQRDHRSAIYRMKSRSGRYSMTLKKWYGYYFSEVMDWNGHFVMDGMFVYDFSWKGLAARLNHLGSDTIIERHLFEKKSGYQT